MYTILTTGHTAAATRKDERILFLLTNISADDGSSRFFRFVYFAAGATRVCGACAQNITERRQKIDDDDETKFTTIDGKTDATKALFSIAALMRKSWHCWTLDDR